MARRLDEIIVVDVESTCWDNEPPIGEQSEIIEIGVCRLDVIKGERLEKRSLIVKPERSTVSAFCTQLTTLTQEQVDAGMTFAEACRTLRRELNSKERAWASFGDYDRRQFERQCASFDVGYPFGPTHINVKTLFALSRRLNREVGLDRALALLGLPLEGIHHRGHDDAWNIAGVLLKLLFDAS